jgi:PKD repeat protein
LIKVKDVSSSAYDECSTFFTINNSAIFSSFSYQTSACNSIVAFTNKSSSSAVTYLWEFGDGSTSTEKSPEHKYLVPGDYNVKLTVSDGTNSSSKIKIVSADFAPLPEDVKAEAQSEGSVNLSANASGTINWYDVATGGTPIATGNSANVISSATTFYAENVTGDETTYKVGEPEKGTQGGYYPYNDNEAIWGLKFDALTDITIKSVKVYNGESTEGGYTGERVIIVKDGSGNTIAQTVVNVIDGEQRLDLNMKIPKGSGYLLLADNKLGFWRDNAGTFTYPYTVNGIVSIIADVRYDGVTNTDYYHFFYDWEVATGTESCTSERVKVDLVTGLEDLKESEISIYPNPATNYVYINNLPNSNCNVILYNSSMQQVKSLKSNGSSDLSVDFNELSSGVYFCRVASENNILTMKKIVIVK